MTLEELIGSQLVFGIPGTTITPEIIQHFKDTHCGGLILYRINFESPDQLRKLISDLENALQRKLLVCADHEGGRVIMFRDGITVFPSSQALGKTGNTHWARQQGEQEGRELRRLGIDVNFAPVLDVLTSAYSPNIGIRSYGEDVELVAKMGAARLSAMQVEGLSAVAKHFPGLGPSTMDPHLKLPTLSVTWEEMEKTHLVPFMRAMRTAVHGIMTSHPLYPLLDPTPKTPATFSRKIVREYLREKTGYKGVIFSDDLEMGAIQELCPIGEAAVKASEAGHDMLLVCHSLQAQKMTFQALLDAYRSKRLLTQDLERSVQRIEVLKGRRTERFAAPSATALRADKERQEAQALIKEICHQSATILRTGTALSDYGSTAVIFPRLSDLSEKIMIEKELLDEKNFLQQRFQAMGLLPSLVLVGTEPTAAEIQAAVQQASTSDQTVLFLYDAHLYSSNKELLDAVQASAKRLGVVLLRDIYDAEFLKSNVLCATNYGWRVCDMDACPVETFQPFPRFYGWSIWMNKKSSKNRIQKIVVENNFHTIAVDRGGTWMRVQGTDSRGRKTRQWKGASISLQELPSFLKALLNRWKAHPRHLNVASRGVWTTTERAQLQHTLSTLCERVHVMSDVEAAWLAAFGESGSGVLVISGTGSIAYGRAHRKTARAGGLGPLLGDEGSGFWIGRQWIKRQGLRLRGISVPAIAHFAPQVIKRARQGDPVAQQIVKEAQKHLALLVQDICHQLDALHAPEVFSRRVEKLPVSWSGSVLNNVWFRSGFEKILGQKLIAPKCQPVEALCHA